MGTLVTPEYAVKIARSIPKRTPPFTPVFYVDFEAESDLDDWWTTVHGVNGGYTDIVDGELHQHSIYQNNIWSGTFNAPHAYVTGVRLPADFEVTVKVRSNTPEQSAGMLIIYQDNDNWIGNSFGYWDARQIRSAYCEAGASAEPVRIGYSPDTVWLRLRKIGDTYYYLYSNNGVTFTQFDSRTQTLTVNRLVIGTKNHAGPAELSDYYYDDFTIRKI